MVFLNDTGRAQLACPSQGGLPCGKITKTNPVQTSFACKVIRLQAVTFQGQDEPSGVAFLKKALDIEFFPELLRVRTEIGTDA